MNNNIKLTDGKIPSTIEILTPVHIGSGTKLLKNYDFFVENNFTKIVSKKELDIYLRNNPKELKKFDNKNFDPKELIKKVKSKKEYDVTCYSKDILEFERNGMGEPYIPGSSIKGAIRTRLFYYYFNSKSEEEKKNLLDKIDKKDKTFASEKLLKEIFGTDSNHNLLRAIEIYDCPLNEVSVNLFRVHVLSLTDKEMTSFKWKKMPSGSTDSIRESTTLFVEMLNPGEKFNLNIKLDNFLIKNEICKKELNFDQNISIEKLSSIVNDYSMKKLKSEIEFFKKIDNKNSLKNVINNLSAIMLEIEKNKKNNCLIIRLGWGSGWKDMTGDYLNNEILNEIRKVFGLGKKGFDIFPKTRKIVFLEDRPAYVPGWVKITFNDFISKERVKEDKKESKKDDNNFDKLAEKFIIKKISK